LKNQLEIEVELHLSDDDQWRLIAGERDKIAAADFTFDGEAEVFEKPFDRQIK